MSKVVRLGSMLAMTSYIAVDEFLQPHGLAFDYMIALTNHSCDYNCLPVVYRDDCGTFYMNLVANRRIQKGEPITITYVNTSLPKELRHDLLKEQYLFECSCDIVLRQDEWNCMMCGSYTCTCERSSLDDTRPSAIGKLTYWQGEGVSEKEQLKFFLDKKIPLVKEPGRSLLLSVQNSAHDQLIELAMETVLLTQVEAVRALHSKSVIHIELYNSMLRTLQLGVLAAQDEDRELQGNCKTIIDGCFFLSNVLSKIPYIQTPGFSEFSTAVQSWSALLRRCHITKGNDTSAQSYQAAELSHLSQFSEFCGQRVQEYVGCKDPLFSRDYIQLFTKADQADQP